MSGKTIVYRRLKNEGINKRIIWTQVFWNKVTNEKGWLFELSDNTTGKYILGKGIKLLKGGDKND